MSSGNRQDHIISSLQLARYCFHFQVIRPLQLPPYASSTLRGVFGRALRQQACLTGAAECRGCPLLAACPYPKIFEPQSVAPASGGQPALAPYAIETPFTQINNQLSPGDIRYHPGYQYCFDMVLMTPAAISQLALIISAWKRAFARGVGKGDGTAELIRVEHQLADGSATTLYSVQTPKLQRHSTELTAPQFTQPQDVQLHLQTPLRLVQKGKLIKEQEITPSLFLRHLIRRVSFHICAQQANAFSLDDIHQLNALADKVKDSERQLHWRDWSRYSIRQKRKMILGGILGYWQLADVPPPLLAFLYFGQWFHVGKESAFGLGKYQWLSE